MSRRKVRPQLPAIRDLSRPISTLINQMRQREKTSITYEDPRYSNAADIEDVTADVSKGSDTEKTYGPRKLAPKGHAITFVYAPTEVGSPEATKAAIERMLGEYSSLGGPAFIVERDGVRLHVLPSEVLNLNDDRVKQDFYPRHSDSVFLRPAEMAANSLKRYVAKYRIILALNLSALKGEDSQATLRITTLRLAPEGSHRPHASGF
jgi:hypothetical protein